MMKQKRMTAIAVACGLVCALCVAAFMMIVQGDADAARAEALARYGGEQIEAYVATRDIVAGERVDLSSVESKLWVADLLPEGAVRSSSDAVGKTATSPIFKGEVITAGRFENDRGSLDVPIGKQAVSVPAKAVQAVGGAIHSGMSIDIYSSGDSTTTLIAQNVSVLDTSVGGSGSLMSSDNGWITLAVDPENVQDLIAASNKTTLYFTLPGEKVAGGDADRKSEPATEAKKDTAEDRHSDADAPEGSNAAAKTSSTEDPDASEDTAKGEEDRGAGGADSDAVGSTRPDEAEGSASAASFPDSAEEDDGSGNSQETGGAPGQAALVASGSEGSSAA